jgi:hypothetical protein
MPHARKRPKDARASLDELMKRFGDAAAYQYVDIYAQWGEKKAALDWLDKAYELHDNGLGYMKVDPLIDPLRQEARFQAVLLKMNFPP